MTGSSSEKEPPNEALEMCVRETEDLHQFFEGWLSGRLSNTDGAFRRVGRALAPEFCLIHPSGAWRSRESILTGLRQGHGSRPDLSIEIRDVRLREEGEELLMATYEEWQWGRETEDGRLSTVLFGKETGGPSGLRWRHVHETWLQEPGG